MLAGRELLSEMGAIVTEIDISKENRNTIKAAFAQAIAFTFQEAIRSSLWCAAKTRSRQLLKKELQRGKLMVGESAGAIVWSADDYLYEPR